MCLCYPIVAKSRHKGVALAGGVPLVHTCVKNSSVV